MNTKSVEDGTQCKTILTFSNTRCRLLEGHSGDHVGKLTDMAAPMSDEQGFVHKEGCPCIERDPTDPCSKDCGFCTCVVQPVEERTQVDPRIYANPTYLAGLFERIKSQRSWKAVKKIFDAEIEEMQKRIPEERTAEMDELMASLRAAAEKITRGRWDHSNRIDKELRTEAAVWGPDGDAIALVYTNLGLDDSAEDISTFIAAASPENILRLLDHIEGKGK